jgi:hypothetical protein
MPGFDRTGPMGAGPMTGGGFGRCGGQAGIGRGGGYGLGRGFGGGYGRGAGFGGNLRFRARGWGYGPMDWGPLSAVDEKSMLEAQVAGLTSELEVVRRRLADLDRRAGEQPDA